MTRWKNTILSFRNSFDSINLQTYSARSALDNTHRSSTGAVEAAIGALVGAALGTALGAAIGAGTPLPALGALEGLAGAGALVFGAFLAAIMAALLTQP